MDPREPLPPEEESIDAELEFHFAETVEALIERGWDESAARIEAERRFGDPWRMGVATVGSLVPAVRASAIEPMRVLRGD